MIGWGGQSSFVSSQVGPSYHSFSPILFRGAPLLPRSARFRSVGQYFHSIPTSSVIWAIFRTLFSTNTFQDFPGFKIQYKATMLSIQTVMLPSGHPLRALWRFFAKFAAI